MSHRDRHIADLQSQLQGPSGSEAVVEDNIELSDWYEDRDFSMDQSDGEDSEHDQDDVDREVDEHHQEHRGDDDTGDLQDLELVESVMSIYSKYNLPQNAVSDILKTIKTYSDPSASLVLPDTYNQALLQLAPEMTPVWRYDVCKGQCYLFRSDSVQTCPVCQSSRFDERGRPYLVFRQLSLVPRLQRLFQHKVCNLLTLFTDLLLSAAVSVASIDFSSESRTRHAAGHSRW